MAEYFSFRSNRRCNQSLSVADGSEDYPSWHSARCAWEYSLRIAGHGFRSYLSNGSVSRHRTFFRRRSPYGSSDQTSQGGVRSVSVKQAKNMGAQRRSTHWLKLFGNPNPIAAFLEELGTRALLRCIINLICI